MQTFAPLTMVRYSWIGLLLCSLSQACPLQGEVDAPQKNKTTPPNIVFILADDLGYGELGSYGQKKIRTPNIDKLAAEGMRFTRHYSGAPVCAPARCVLMTGKHLTNAQIRGNRDARKHKLGGEGQWPLDPGTVTLPAILQNAGYSTGGFGKWGLGNAQNSGSPNKMGFDTFYGYLCQRVAHSYFPPYLNHNEKRERINLPAVPGHFKVPKKEGSPEVDFDRFQGRVYAPDRILEEAVQFLREHNEGPFFLYLPFVEPHVAMQPPPEWVEAYPKEWDSEPYLGRKGYTPHPRPRAGYAAMISDLDEHVGTIMSELKALSLDEDTLVVFTSDNGPTHDVGGVDTEFFGSTGGLRGRKGSVFEGGLRVPMIARWKGKIREGSTCDRPCGFQDFLPHTHGIGRHFADRLRHGTTRWREHCPMPHRQPDWPQIEAIALGVFRLWGPTSHFVSERHESGSAKNSTQESKESWGLATLRLVERSTGKQRSGQ